MHVSTQTSYYRQKLIENPSRHAGLLRGTAIHKQVIICFVVDNRWSQVISRMECCRLTADFMKSKQLSATWHLE